MSEIQDQEISFSNVILQQFSMTALNSIFSLGRNPVLFNVSGLCPKFVCLHKCPVQVN